MSQPEKSLNPLAVGSRTAFSAQVPHAASPLNLSFRNQNNEVAVASSASGSARKVVQRLVRGTAMALIAFTLFQGPAHAAKAAKDTAEHLHTGQKIANFFMNFGLPKWAVLATISAMPVVELRGAVPVGIWLGMPISQVLPICVLGNMTPIIPLLFLLRNESLK